MHLSKSKVPRFLNNQKTIPYIYILPFFVLFAVFTVYPVLHSLYLSLFDFKGIQSKLFVGFQNYATLFSDFRFKMALFNTTYFAIGMIALTLLISFPISLILSSNQFPGVRIFRLVFFMPILASLVVAGAIFKLIFLDSEAGLLNSLLGMLNISPQKWLLQGFLPINAVLIMAFWRRMGLAMMYFMAGIQSIPSDIYESAMIDGASGWQRLRYITIPLMKPIFSFVIVITLIYSFLAFDEVYVLNPAGAMDSPQNNMVTLGLHLYETGFQLFKFGYSSAIGFIVTLIILMFSFFQMRLLGVIGERHPERER